MTGSNESNVIASKRVIITSLYRRSECGAIIASESLITAGFKIVMAFRLAAVIRLGAWLVIRADGGSSKGVLVADIGMTVDEVKSRSTLKIRDPRHMGDGSRMGIEEIVFDYQIGDSGMRFPRARYYWLETRKGDVHISGLNVAQV
jgi:hypothetical protein